MHPDTALHLTWKGEIFTYSASLVGNILSWACLLLSDVTVRTHGDAP